MTGLVVVVTIARNPRTRPSPQNTVDSPALRSAWLGSGSHRAVTAVGSSVAAGNESIGRSGARLGDMDGEATASEPLGGLDELPGELHPLAIPAKTAPTTKTLTRAVRVTQTGRGLPSPCDEGVRPG